MRYTIENGAFKGYFAAVAFMTLAIAMVISVACGQGNRDVPQGSSTPLLIESGKPDLASADTPTEVTRRDDKAQIVRLALEWALVEKKIPDYDMLARQDDFVLSLENIDPGLVPEMPGIDLRLLTPPEIQAEANKKTDFLYLKFKTLEVSDSAATVGIDNVWAEAQGPRLLAHLSGGGCTLNFTEESGNWVMGQVSSCWIS
ncbi:MAG TPA: hypothetical protein VFR55_05015 [Dehalococcoidia bacterium]|nr:hypothetical protein [Dehalococcoidia bacterium]